MSIDLFTTFSQRVLIRLEDVLANRECPWPIGEDERNLLNLLKAHRGRDRAIPLGYACERLKVTPRQIKELVQNLRLNYRVQICASRDGSTGGYFLATSAQEVAESTTQMWHQAVAMLRVVHALRGSEYEIAEMLGQLRIDLEKEEQHAR